MAEPPPGTNMMSVAPASSSSSGNVGQAIRNAGPNPDLGSAEMNTSSDVRMGAAAAATRSKPSGTMIELEDPSNVPLAVAIICEEDLEVTEPLEDWARLSPTEDILLAERHPKTGTQFLCRFNPTTQQVSQLQHVLRRSRIFVCEGGHILIQEEDAVKLHSWDMKVIQQYSHEGKLVGYLSKDQPVFKVRIGTGQGLREIQIKGMEAIKPPGLLNTPRDEQVKWRSPLSVCAHGSKVCLLSSSYKALDIFDNIHGQWKHLCRNPRVAAKEQDNVMTCSDKFIFIVGYLMKIRVYDWKGTFLRFLDPEKDLRLYRDCAVVAIQYIKEKDALKVLAVAERRVLLREISVRYIDSQEGEEDYHVQEAMDIS